VFTLKIETKSQILNNFLQLETQMVDDVHYTFPSLEKAADVLSRYALYQIKESELEKLLKQKKLEEKDRELFLMHLSDKIVSAILDDAKRIFHFYLQTNDEIQYDGFVQFRLKEQKGMLVKEIEKAYKMFINKDNVSGPEYFREIMKKQEPLEQEVKLIVDNGQVMVKGEKHTYYKNDLSPYDYDTEDNVLTHIIIISPKFLRVYDPKNELSKQTVIILNEIFKEKVIFHRERYIGN
jgi:hypothetical protein